jgi:membrane-associated protein
MIPLAAGGAFVLLGLTGAVHTDLPSWIQTPVWFHPLTRSLAVFIARHQGAGLFLVIFAEELGIPLPAPGDVAIAWGGYLSTTGAIPLPLAYAGVIGGAVLGSSCLYWISRRFGHPFLLRFGRYVGLDEGRLAQAERYFRRWGPWAIILGRHVPGMRVVISAFAGAFEVPFRIFVPSVLVSAAVWATIFLELGRYMGRNSRFLFTLVPAHLLPLVFLLAALLGVVFLAFEHGWRPRRRARKAEPAGRAPEPGEATTRP